MQCLSRNRPPVTESLSRLKLAMKLILDLARGGSCALHGPSDPVKTPKILLFRSCIGVASPMELAAFTLGRPSAWAENECCKSWPAETLTVP